MTQILKQSTAVDVLIGPFVDSTNGYDAEAGLSPAVKLSKNGQTMAAKNESTTPAHDADGYYNCMLDATDTNTVGTMVATVAGSATALPVRHEYQVVEEAVYDAMFAASAAGPLQSTTAGRTLDVETTGEAGVDFNNVNGTLAGGEIAVGAFAAGAITAAAIATDAITAAKIAANAITSSEIADNAITAAKIATDAITSTKIAADAIGASELATDAIGAAQLATDAAEEISDTVWDEVLTGATHNVSNSAGKRLRELQEVGTYGGAVWVDTVNGSAGAVSYENGTDTNPVNNMADANTLATNLGLSRFVMSPDSSVTFAVSQQNQLFLGMAWTVALGGQNIDGTSINGATVSGIGTSTSGTQYFQNCMIGAVTIPKNTHFLECAISGTQTLGVSGDFFYDRCHSAIAGTAAPAIDFGAGLAASNLSVRNYSGGIEIQNMGAGAGSYAMSLEGRGQLIINANCSATSTVAIRGHFTVTDNAGGAVTLSDDARIDVGQINGEVLDVMNTDTITLPGQTAPPLAPTHRQAIAWLYKVLRNRKTQTATQWSLLADDESIVDAKATISDDTTTAVKQEIVSGP